MKKLNVNNANNGSIFLGIVFVIILLSENGWGACINIPETFSLGSFHVCNSTGCSGPDECQYKATCQDAVSYIRENCPSVHIGNGYYYIQPTPGITSYNYPGSGTIFTCPQTNTNCYVDASAGYFTLNCRYNIRGSNQCEADSAVCVSQGNFWTTDPSASCGKSCKINHCTAADTAWLSTSIAACTGSNNYAIVNTDSTCEHVGTCCPNDSIPEGNSCKWRCDSLLTQCNGRAGALFGAVLPDTSVSGQDTTFSYQCFYNCAHSPNPDSTVYLVEGNTILAGPSDSIADGIKSEWFSSIRSTTGSIYVYDYLSPSASEYVDSIAAMKCVEHLWRCVINSKYVYWYDNQEVPAGCTNIVRVK